MNNARMITEEQDTHAMNITLLIGALLGLMSVSVGAYAEHGLRPHIDDETFRYVMTAIRFNQVYAVVVTGLGLALFANLPARAAKHLPRVGAVFALGTVLFSVSIYASAQLAIPSLTYLTPVGGVTLMLGWAYLIVVAIIGRKIQTP